MRRSVIFLPIIMLILLLAAQTGGIVLGQDPTATPTPTETPTDPPTDTPTDTPTEIPTETPTETGTATETPTDVPSETPIVTATDVTETATATLTGEPPTTTPTETGTAIPTLPPTLTPSATFVPTGVTQLFFFQGLPDQTIDLYTNGVQLGSSLATGSMVGPFALLDGTATTFMLFPAGTVGQPLLFSTLAFEPGSTVLVTTYVGPGGVPALSVFRLDLSSAQSQLIVINASDAPALDVAAGGGQTSIASGQTAQFALQPGTTGGVTAAGAAGAQAANPMHAGTVTIQFATGSVANGTFQVITQTIDLASLSTITGVEMRP